MTILVSDLLLSTRGDDETSKSSKASSFQDNPNICSYFKTRQLFVGCSVTTTLVRDLLLPTWEASPDKSGKAISLQDVSSICVDFWTLQVFVGVLLPVTVYSSVRAFQNTQILLNRTDGC